MRIFHQSTFDPWPLESSSVQAIITSPPYWGLRKYDIPDIVIGGWKGQYGLEPTFQLYIEHTLLWIQEAYRVLRDDGCFFLNVSDSYGGSWGGYSHGKGPGQYGVSGKDRGPLSARPDMLPPTAHAPAKSQCAIPERIMIALIDGGWIRRNCIIWHKPTAMPESITDRFSKKYEPIYFFVKSRKYYFDLDAVREEFRITTLERAQRRRIGPGIPAGPSGPENRPMPGQLNENGRNPGDLWTIPAQPSPYKHYAMWPEALVERMIRCSTRPGDTVLDPFCGSGRTLRVAFGLSRKAYGIDLGYRDIQEQVCGMFLNAGGGNGKRECNEEAKKTGSPPDFGCGK